MGKIKFDQFNDYFLMSSKVVYLAVKYLRNCLLPLDNFKEFDKAKIGNLISNFTNARYDNVRGNQGLYYEDWSNCNEA